MHDQNRPKYFPGFPHDGEHIINPTCCDPRGMVCDPREYGFKTVGTGGGCTGLAMYLPEGRILLTDESGTSDDLGEAGEEFLLGLYNDDGDTLGEWVMKVGVPYHCPEDATEGDDTPVNTFEG